MMRRRKVVLGVLLLLAAVALVPNPIRTAALQHVGSRLDVGTAFPEPVDYVMSLGGGESIRPFVGAALVNTGIADRALVVQGTPNPDVRDGIKPSTQMIIRDVYLARGVPSDKLVYLDGEVSSTFDEARAARRFLHSEAQPVRLAVVTHGFHTRRAAWTFRDTLGDDQVELVIVSAPHENFELTSWWKTQSGFITVTSEYLKLAFYRLRYGNGVWWLLGAAGIFGWLVFRRARCGAASGRATTKAAAVL